MLSRRHPVPPALRTALLAGWAARSAGWPALLTGCAALLAGCAGGQTGEEEHFVCPVRVTALAPDESSPLGLSPGQISKQGEGEHRAAIEWLPAPATPYGPESGQSELTLGVATLGSARLVMNEDAERPCCEDNVQVDVRVTLATSAGAFNEVFDSMLFAQSADQVALFQQLAPEVLAGSFAFAGLSETERFKVLQLNARFEQGTFSGSLLAGIEQASGNGPDSSVSMGPVPLARWGKPVTSRAWCAGEAP